MFHRYLSEVRFVPAEKAIISIAIGCILMLLAPVAHSASFPMEVSADGRYLQDQNGDPFWVHCDTIREVGVRYPIEDTREFFDIRRSQGFNAQLMLLIPWQVHEANYYGRKPFNGDNRSFTNINEAYWQDMDRVMEAAATRGVLVFAYPLWTDCCAATWQEAMRNANSDADMNWYGQFVGNRYGQYNNVVWVQGGDSDSGNVASRINAMVAGINATHPVHLHTFHSICSENASDGWRANESWLNVSTIYTYGRDNSACSHMPRDWYAYEHAKREWDKHNGMPFFFIEGHYEGGEPGWYYRRFPIWTTIGGGMGHVFGHSALFSHPGNWRDEMYSSGTTAVCEIREAFVDVAGNWYEMVPDWNHNVMTSGYGNFTGSDYIVCASAPNGTLVMAYVTQGYGTRTFTIDMSAMAQPSNAIWYDPTNGVQVDAGTNLPNSGSRNFTSPGTNSYGDHDWLFILKAPEGPQLEAPTNVTATAVSGQQVNLTWDDNSSDPQEDRFVIQRKPFQGVDEWQTVGTALQNATSHDDTNLVHGQVTYTYRVGAEKD